VSAGIGVMILAVLLAYWNDFSALERVGDGESVRN
jgi:hypothetical protein